MLQMVMLIAFSMMTLAAKADNATYSEDKTNITVTAEQPEFVLKLKSNPTTGYSWFLQEYNSSLITPVKHFFQAPTKGLMGAPGFDFWTFRVKPQGFAVPQQTTIRMVYARAWESKDSETQIVFKVSTQGK